MQSNNTYWDEQKLNLPYYNVGFLINRYNY